MALAVLVGLTAVTLVAAVSTGRDHDRAHRETAEVYEPARVDVEALARAAVDQQNGLRGFALAPRAELLEPYHAGRRSATELIASLSERLDGDAELERAVTGVRIALERWVRDVAEPRLALFAAGGQLSDEEVSAGNVLFDDVRTRLDELRSRVDAAAARARRVEERAHPFVTRVALGSAGLALAAALAVVVLWGRWVVRPFGAVTGAVRRVAAGDLSIPVPATGPPELAGLADDVERMRQRLLAEAAAALNAAYLTAAESERARIAADIHDDTIQVMTAIGMRLELLHAELDDPDQRVLVERSQQSISAATARLRNLLFELAPPSLENAGLIAALEDYLAFAFGGSGVEWTVEDELTEEPPIPVRATLYRVVRELLMNVRKHAGSSRVVVRVAASEGGVTVAVADDGAGFDPRAPSRPGHLGLPGAQAMVESAGGRWSLRSRRGEGTVVEVWLPIPADR